MMTSLHLIIERAQAALQITQQQQETPYAVFDADGTLWTLDVAFRLYEYLIEHRLVKTQALSVMQQALKQSGLEVLQDPNRACLAVYQGFLNQKMEEQLAFETMITSLAGFTLQELHDIHHHALGHHAQLKVKDKMFKHIPWLFEQLKHLGFKIAVISASPIWTVEYAVLCCGLKPDVVCGGTTYLNSGIITPNIKRPMSYYHGKLEIAQSLFQAPPTIGFGDGRGDIPFLSQSRVAVCINPRPALKEAMISFKNDPILVSWS